MKVNSIMIMTSPRTTILYYTTTTTTTTTYYYHYYNKYVTKIIGRDSSLLRVLKSPTQFTAKLHNKAIPYSLERGCYSVLASVVACHHTPRNSPSV